MEKKTIIVRDLAISYYQSDSFNPERTLVFLHGWGSEATHLKNILDVCQNYVALDLPGFGGSNRPQKAWSLEEYSSFLNEFLTKVGIRNPILIGHSFGGSVIIKYLQKYDSSGVILIDSAGIRKHGLKIQVYKVLAKIFKIILLLMPSSNLRRKIRAKIYTAIDSEDYINAGELIDIYRKTIREDLQEEMSKIKIPVTLIWGEKDTATPLENAKKMENLIKGSKLWIIPEAGHFPFIDKQEEFLNIFLKEINDH